MTTNRLKVVDVDAEARFEATFQNAFVGIAHVGTDGRWLRINDTLAGIVGYDADEMRNLTFQDITHPDDLDADLALLEQLANGEIDHYRMEKRYIRKDGETVWVDLQVAPQHSKADRLLYYITTVLDISRFKRIEEELREAQRNSEHLMGIMAHDLLNPLNSISSQAELLKILKDSEAVSRCVDGILKQTSETAKFVGTLRQVSKLDAAGQSLEDVSLSEILERVLETCATAIRQAGASVQVANDLPTVRTNRIFATHVIHNLIDNAIKYQHPQRECIVDVRAERLEGVVALEVSDNGRGIPGDDVNAIFEPAKRGSNVGDAPGHGLGMALCKRSMENMGGSIAVKSSVLGEGTCIALRFPAAD